MHWQLEQCNACGTNQKISQVTKPDSCLLKSQKGLIQDWPHKHLLYPSKKYLWRITGSKSSNDIKPLNTISICCMTTVHAYRSCNFHYMKLFSSIFIIKNWLCVAPWWNVNNYNPSHQVTNVAPEVEQEQQKLAENLFVILLTVWDELS